MIQIGNDPHHLAGRRQLLDRVLLPVSPEHTANGALIPIFPD
jgi:hypothetical protein